MTQTGALPGYVNIESSDDTYAPEHIGDLAAAAPVDAYRDYGLDVLLNGDGTVSVSDGKWYVILPEATAEWTDASGSGQTETLYNVLMDGHLQPVGSVALESTSGMNYVFAWLDHANGSPKVVINTSGTPEAVPTNQQSGTEPVAQPDMLLIAEVDPVAGTVTPRNQYPDAEFGAVEAHSEFLDPAGRSHPGEMADVSDVRTDEEIGTLAQERVDAYDHYNDTDAVAAANAEDQLDVGVTGEAGAVVGANVSGQVADAAHADQADNAAQAGGINPSDFLRTDTRDRLNADINANNRRVENLDALTFSSSSGAAIDLSPNSDGTHVVVEHDGYRWQSRPGNDEPFAVKDPDGDVIYVDGDHLRVPRGDVFAADGRLASQRWANEHFYRSGQTLDLMGETLSGVNNIQPSGGRIDIYGGTNVRGNLDERGERVATRDWVLDNLPLRGHDHDGDYYRKGETYSTGQADSRFAPREHSHSEYVEFGEVWTRGQANGRFASAGHDHSSDTIDPNRITSSGGILSMPVQIQGPRGIVFGDGGFLHQNDDTGELMFQYNGTNHVVV